MPIHSWSCKTVYQYMRTNKKYLSSEEENGFSPFELIKTLKATLRRQSAKQLAFKG